MCVGYGVVGAARAIEHPRLIAVDLQMAPTRTGVHLQLVELDLTKMTPGCFPRAQQALVERGDMHHLREPVVPPHRLVHGATE